MAKEQHDFNEFIENIGDDHIEFYKQMNDFLEGKGYTTKVELKKTGYSVSYISNETKRTLLNYGTRKKGVFVRIYGDHASDYLEIFNEIPESMRRTIKNAPICKRFIDDSTCNPRCKKGINVVVDGENYGLCRFSALMFFIDEEIYNSVEAIVNKEIQFLD